MANRKGARKTPELSPETVEANAAGEARREKEKKARRANAEKQRRFRENMKAGGFRQVLLWDFPCLVDVRERMTAAGFRQVPAWENGKPETGESRQEKRRADPGRVKVAAVIRESSLGIADRAPDVRRALSNAIFEFSKVIGESPETNKLYEDVRELLRPLGALPGNL
jgi:hypothetical protein